MKIAYFDLIAGASGDMILGALVDAGLSIHRLRQDLSALRLDDFTISAHPVIKNGFSATKINISVQDNVSHRHLPDINEIISKSSLPALIQQKAIAIFHRLGTVEAGIHGTSLEKIHLHELGGVDTIVDVVGTLLAIEALQIQKIVTSAVPLGRGFIRGAHGNIPLPAPATVALLQGVPVYGVDLEAETVTPTGAVLLSSLSDSFGPIPAMCLQSSGYGAGGRDLPIPNVVRLLIGEEKDPGSTQINTLVMLETNIDDLNPEFYSYVMARLFATGALDVFFTPIHMKKNRPGTLFQVLAEPNDSERLRQILFEETSTLGIRQHLVQRYALKREVQQVQTPYGNVRIKVASIGEAKTRLVPEYEDCRLLAEQHGIPLQEIYQAAQRAAHSLLD